jgi:uncharacterized membrane protein
MKRPLILSIICVIGFLWVVVTFPGVFSPSVKKLGVFMPAIYGLIVAATFISFIGVWHLKRWGMELYALSFFSKMAFFILTKSFEMTSIIGIVFSVWFMTTYLFFYKKMDVNL